MAQAKYMTSDSFFKRHSESIKTLMLTAVILGVGYYGFNTGKELGMLEERINPEHRNLKRYETYTVEGEKYFLDKEEGQYILKKDK